MGCCLFVSMQDGQELRPGPNCRIYSAGRRRILQLNRCELTDTGSYTCDAGDCRASATLHVQGMVTHLPAVCTPLNPTLPALFILGCSGTLSIIRRAPGPHCAGAAGRRGARG